MYGPYEIIYSKIQERFPFCLFMLSLPNKTCWGFNSLLCDLQNELNLFFAHKQSWCVWQTSRMLPFFSCLFFAMRFVKRQTVLTCFDLSRGLYAIIQGDQTWIRSFKMNPKVFQTLNLRSDIFQRVWMMNGRISNKLGPRTQKIQPLMFFTWWFGMFLGSRIDRNLIGICLNWSKQSDDPQATAF